ncbi:transcriptional regulator TyrR [Rosenbergiella sp. S61]|uniref:HTH-type transcriptional regulatory protein TyrR n=1 Tax=Rosenbergiella gaditana TaxID=2726987 RepID=A0ABS5SWA3_9GAMM|nr:transcriptional regulator TyrR [Rosenbergiella gaditana]MBT0723058.1 transcriptional regulator TyrR [Rosenbergiella gaditana]
MRLEVQCQDRQGLVHELLNLLVKRNIDLYGIEISENYTVYLRFSSVNFDDFSGLMAEIRRTPGVSDVRRVTYMPSEQAKRALHALVNSLPEPVLCTDLKGRIELTNMAAQQLFALDNHSPAQLLTSLLPNIELPQFHTKRSLPFTLQGRDFLVEICPLFLPDDDTSQVQQTGTLVIFKSATEIGRGVTVAELDTEGAFNHVIADSPKMRQVVQRAKKLAMHDAPLLIIGETGTGKDIIARACHQLSPRHSHPFLALNCGSLPDDVAESELFGHAAGAYPNAFETQKGFFEQAAGGSVFLDEIGEMSPSLQTKLLRFLNDGTFRRVGDEHEVHVDVRVICATQKNLQELVDLGTFREDLFYRLNVLSLQLPALREHPQDLMALASFFVARFAHEQGITVPRLAPSLATHLSRYHWPGNVRQLKNCLYAAMTQCEGDELRPQDVNLPNFTNDDDVDILQLEGSLDEINGRFERSVLTKLYASYPSTRKLAKRLGVSHTAIANKLREYGVGQKNSKPKE